ncbi:oligosaccharide flippase family protein [Candidatus Binatus sp.]|jgi:O-antigen/teichoic acid export membrane protein|uniref:oligosaccharide flippase family protein n=1 Tax=Candidatus Binatus sp. TaxID=2811406 RepID=UPI003BCD4E1A
MPHEPVKQAAPSVEASAPERDSAGASDRDAENAGKIREALLKTFFTGLSWTAAARGLTSIGTAARYIVFVRLLKPFDFGVIASATLICSGLLAATDPVMGQALIQQEDEIAPYLDTLLTTSFVRSLIIGVILIVFSRPLGAFFHLGDAYTVFWAMVPLPILRGIQSPRLISLYRRLDFHFLTILNVSEVAAGFVFGLMAVLYWRDWRGLVFSILVGAAVRDILTYWLFPHWPRLSFSMARAKTMLSFGLWFSFGTLCDFISKQLDNLVVGHLLGPGALGNYQMAFRAGEMPVAEFTTSAFVVTFPMVARLRGDRHARAHLFWSVIAVVAAVGVAYGAFIFAFGAQTVLRLFGPAWVHAVNPLKVLCIYGLLQGFLVVGRSFLSGLGHPERYVVAAAVRAGVLAIAIYPLTALHGPTGAAAAGVLSILVALPIMGYLLQQTE